MHLRSCKPKEEKGGRQLPAGVGADGDAGAELSGEGATREGRKPRMLTCYMCGQVSGWGDGGLWC